MTAFDPDGQAPPVVEADPDTLEDVLRQILGDRSTYQELAARGPAWSRRNHGNCPAAAALTHFL